jgi:hypothetical protein
LNHVLRRPAALLDSPPQFQLGVALALQWLSALAAAVWSQVDEPLGDPVVLLNVVLLGPLALAAAFVVARRLGGAALGLWTLLVWLAAPWLLAAFALPSYDATARDHVVPLLYGLEPEPGYAAGTALVVAAALMTVPQPRWAVGVGVALGTAALLEPATLVFAAAAGLALLVERRLRSLAAAAAALLPFVAALALWQGLDVADRSLDAFEGTMVGLREYFWSQRLLQWLPLAGAIAVGRRSLPLAILLGGGFLAFGLAQTALQHASFDDGLVFELLLPGLPVYVLLVAAIPLLVPTLATRLGDDARPVRLRRTPESDAA